MNKKSRQLSELFQPIGEPSGLFAVVCQRIEQAKVARARIRSAAFAVTSVLSLVGLVMSSSSVSSGFAQSGFSQYLSLLFSDAGVISAFWMDFIQSLAESLPILPLAVVLGSFWLFLESIKYLFEDVPVIRRSWRF